MTAADRQVVKRYLLDGATELKGYRCEINRLKARITVLETMEEALKEKMERYSLLLLPVHCMPPEILVEIFKLSCRKEVFGTKGIPRAMVLSRVCARWNQVALSVPQLWASISVRFDIWCRTGREKMDRLKRFVDLFMKYSKTAPLSITLDDAGAIFEPVPFETLNQVMTAIGNVFANSDRWHRLEYTHYLLALPQLQQIVTCLLNLEHFETLGISSDESRIILATQEFPSLTSITIVPDLWNPDDLPFHQATTLSFFRSHASAALAILRRCTNARRLALKDVGGDADNSSQESGNHIILPHLQYLSIVANNEQDATFPFQSSTLPVLSSIVLHGVPPSISSWTRWNLDPVKDFLLCSSCPITSLSLRTLPLSDVETISLLVLLPTLNSLTIHEDRYSEARTNKIFTRAFLKHFSTLHEDMTSRSFLPVIQNLDFTMHHSPPSRPALVSAIASRAPDGVSDHAATSVARLQSFTLTIMVKEKVDVAPFLTPLQYFRDAGLRLDISFKAI
ncbi:hypothetical protein AAF712_003269 [Marasmius tenuissimus]|uniref:F-box domain-containing protein n=1 Tax=Marasmius tenuissimus TaxID=585030 RepID=A0ABR3A6T0_9AGAR